MTGVVPAARLSSDPVFLVLALLLLLVPCPPAHSLREAHPSVSRRPQHPRRWLHAHCHMTPGSFLVVMSVPFTPPWGS